MIIGKYELTLEEDDAYLTEDEVGIIMEDGEGGAFDKEELFKRLEAVIDEFYKENF